MWQIPYTVDKKKKLHNISWKEEVVIDSDSDSYKWFSCFQTRLQQLCFILVSPLVATACLTWLLAIWIVLHGLIQADINLDC